ncbi:MAG: CHASE2 domain-containing protein [Betaproteobacteria bacterium]|nr:CHASE2 domain-containing protein [Betaproteobacteria bacterium]
MKKAAFWKADWFLALLIVIGVLVFSRMSELIPSLERKAYDLGVKATTKTPSDKIAVIAIDDQSIANIGRWPWSREVHAKMTDQLAAAKVKVIGNTVFFFEPQLDPGLAYINKLIDLYKKSLPPESDLTAVPGNPEVAQYGPILREAESALNTDRRLAESFQKAGNVLLPAVFELGEQRGKPDKPLPEYLVKNAIPGEDPNTLYPPAVQAIYPIEALGKVAAGMGHLNAELDADGAIRQEPLVIDFYGQRFPSLSAMIAARSLNLAPKDIRVASGESVSLGKLKIRTDPNARMYTYFYADKDNRPAFTVDSFYDVYTGKIPATKYADKIVLIGATAAGVGGNQVTPIRPDMSPVTTLAHSVSSILQEHFFVVPTWAQWAQLGIYLLVALFLILLLPRLKAGLAFGVTAGLAIVLIGTHFGLMTGTGMWLQLMLPTTLLLVGYLLMTTKRFLVTEQGKEKADTESAESNRMLGLAFQQQGQLDMAFEKFRKCPVDEQLLENIYSLALDFERRRQFNKAENAFLYIAKHDSNFRDVGERTARAKAMSETIILGGSSAARSAQATMVLSGSGEKPKLGRYTVEKELGKGAMGVVYLGKDPKIGREVAIKTMGLSAEFEGDELQEAKDRFFREAESAGKLDHPCIVKIFDAGEEHDLAYIAMEFLKGKDLVQYTKNPNLLPLPKVLSIIARCAEALHHAHGLNIVHRDIKPANIMYDPETDIVKVTDFGIARVTDSSKTKTGMVLGTPSYMSPEQLAGKKIDGRSDLFSLTVSMYQMACGKLPFEGESMTQLMFRIANEPHPNILEYNPALPEWMKDLMDHGLAKNADERFQNGLEMAAAIKTYQQIG